MKAAEFTVAEVVNPAENDGRRGVIAAVILGTETIASVSTVSVIELIAEPHGVSGSATGRLAFVDGLKPPGVGQPVENLVTVQGNAVRNLCNASEADVTITIEAPPAFAPFIRGDVNSDVRVNIADAVRLVQRLFYGSTAASCRAAADVDADGDLDITDPIRLINCRLRGGPVPDSPFPSCGRDDGTNLGCATHGCDR